MNVARILNKSLCLVTPQMHDSRRSALSACVASLFGGSSATVTRIGRGLSSNAKEKHKIKRADRLLSNHRLQGEVMTIYTSMARTLLEGIARPIILRLVGSGCQQTAPFASGDVGGRQSLFDTLRRSPRRDNEREA